MNNILNQGVVTPFVLFTFPDGFVIEDLTQPNNINDVNCAPRFFINLHHNRTCSQACSFKLDIVYVPDTFSTGNPYLIDSKLVQCSGEQIKYRYGYYDCYGRTHYQQAEYVGQIYTYNSEVDILNGTINYTIEGCATASELASSMAKIEATNELTQPTVYLEALINEATSGGFKDLRDLYEVYIPQKIDTAIFIPNFDSAPVLDLIMGAVTSTKNNGVPVRKGGLVQLSLGPEITGTENLSHLLTEEEYNILHNQYGSSKNNIQSIGDAEYYKKKYEAIKNAAKAKLQSPFVCYIDDISPASGKLGTLIYKCKDRTNNLVDSNYVYYMGNEFRSSFEKQDVLSFAVNYNGAKALASGKKTGNTSIGIDAAGNNQGYTYNIDDVGAIGKTVNDTKSGNYRNLITSIKELTDIMIYPFEATMTVVGQLQPSHLLDIISVTVFINGTEHKVLSGDYMILEITDEISSSGFTTTFKLIRQDLSALTQPTETISGVGDAGKAGEVQVAIDTTQPQPTSGTSGVGNQNRT